jgi:hypothetical protein
MGNPNSEPQTPNCEPGVLYFGRRTCVYYLCVPLTKEFE